MIKIVLALIVVALGINCTSAKKADENSSANRDPAGFLPDGFFRTPKAAPLDNATALKSFSSGQLDIQKARVIIDNDAAFESKLKIVDSANQELRMVYYIYSDDYTSSYFTQKLINKARSGVKVKLLVDFITNYSRMDLFEMMKREGGPNMDIRFYGVPTATIMRDAVYLTSPCHQVAKPSADQCAKEKWARIQEQMANINKGEYFLTPFSKLFLAGLYAKNATAVQNAVILGQQINVEELKKGSGNSSAEDKKQLKEFFKLLIQAKMKKDPNALIKLNLAMATYGDTLNPIMNMLTGTAPIEQFDNVKSYNDWNHLTDYTHHKLIIADGTYFQLGGRNIEDSYHTKPRNDNLVNKYIFMDTDFYAELNRQASKSGGARIEKSFDDLFNFSAMVATLEQVRAFAPTEFIFNSDKLKPVIGQCMASGKPESIPACVESARMQLEKQTLSARLDAQKSLMIKNSGIYQQQIAPVAKATQSWKTGTTDDEITDPQLFVGYIENVPYEMNQNPQTGATMKSSARVYGDEDGKINSGKNIHTLWMKELENACAISSKLNAPVPVVLHTAYLIPPSNILATFRKMIDGTWDCHNVDVTLITNSFETTDLNIINLFFSYQIKAFVEFYKRSKSPLKAHFNYYEYDKSKMTSTESLHTKLSVFGSDVVIGSANMDVRSYHMDTNNGVFIRGGQQLASSYLEFIRGLIKDKKLLPINVEAVSQKTLDQMRAEDVKKMLAWWAAKQKAKGRTDDIQNAKWMKFMPRAQEIYHDFTENIYKQTAIIMDHSQFKVDEKDAYDGDSYSSQKVEGLQKAEQRRQEILFNNIWQLL